MRDRRKFLEALAIVCVMSGGLTFGGQKVVAAEADANVETVTVAECEVNVAEAENVEVVAVVENIMNEAETESIEIVASDTESGKDGAVLIDEKNFPDPIFREKIKCFDKDKDGSLSEEEIQNARELICINYDEYEKTNAIESLKGIEIFTNLQTLRVSNNNIKEIDLSKNTELQELYVDGNILENLDISKNVKIKRLKCNTNYITQLDISNLPDLVSLDCSNNELKSLDVSKNLKLSTLICNENALGNLDVSKNTALTSLYCIKTGLQNLDITGNTALEELSCSDNSLKVLDISKNTALRELHCKNNELTDLNLNNNKALTKCLCSGNKLTKLDVSQNAELEWLYCRKNAISSLDLSNNLKLTDLDCAVNQIENLDITKNEKITLLKIYHNPMTKIDIHKQERLKNVVEKGGFMTHDADNVEMMSYSSSGAAYLYADKDDEFQLSRFKDLEKGAWYESVVQSTTELGYMNGTSESTFDPNGKLTRAQFVTVLHNIAGGETLPIEEYNAKFSDIPEGMWYTNPVMWALKNDITSGISENSFGTDMEITREQLITLLYKYAKIEGRKQTGGFINYNETDWIIDKDKISDWAKEAMKWAVEYNVISGKPIDEYHSQLDPKGKATRAECAQIIYMYVNDTVG